MGLDFRIYGCVADACTKKKECRHHTVLEEQKIKTAKEVSLLTDDMPDRLKELMVHNREYFEQDLFDICNGERLYISHNDTSTFLFKGKDEYIELFNFSDQYCKGNCTYVGELDRHESNCECLLYDGKKCNNEKHPEQIKHSRMVEEINSKFTAISEAFEKANIEYGEVFFKCEICGGQAKAWKYEDSQGSTCTECKSGHMT